MNIGELALDRMRIGRDAAFRCAALVVPVVACVVATGQVRAAKTGTLTPWKGGGFGMFSTTDGTANRFVFVTATDAAGEHYRVRLPRGPAAPASALSARAIGRLQSAPTLARASALASAILTVPMTPAPPGSFAAPRRASNSEEYGPALARVAPTTKFLEATGRASSLAPIAVIREVAVQIVRLRFDQETGIVSVERIGPLGRAAVDGTPLVPGG